MGRKAPYVKFIEESDILYVRLRSGPIARTHGLGIWRNLDLDTEGRVVSVEFVNASNGIRLDDVPERETVERLMREAGIRLVPVVMPPDVAAQLAEDDVAGIRERAG